MNANYFTWQVPNEMSPADLIKDWQREVPKGVEKFDEKKFFSFPIKDESKEKSSNEETNKRNITNLDATWNLYDALEKKKYQSDYDNGVLPYIKKGTLVRLPATELTLIIKERLNSDRQFTQTDYQTLFSEHYEDIINDEHYANLENVTTEAEKGLSTKMLSLNARVYIYCKSIKKIIDVSPFISDLSTDKTLESGAFNITLAPFKNTSIEKYGVNYLETFNVVNENKYHVKDFLEKFCQYNDIVFIRFERLQLEKDSEPTSLIVEKENLPYNKNIWDMIGFVDNCTIHNSAEDISRYILIEGRDFTKFLEDDGSYFLPLKDVAGSSEFTVYGNQKSAFFQRNSLTGCYHFIWTGGFKTIAESIWFIINVCSNLGVTTNDLFSAWKERRLTSFPIDGVRKMDVYGVWQILKVYLDNACMNRILVDSSFGNPNGTIMSLIQRVCQQPFIEFFIDTYKDTIDMTVRQPPFNKKAIDQIIASESYIKIDPSDIYDLSLNYDTRFYSWYQIYAQNAWTANTAATSIAMVPIIYLPEYSYYFGNKKLEVGDIYLHIEGTLDNKEKFRQANYQKSALNDLLYLVESTAYLPFTRRGTITLCGDRRIKVGTFVYNEATNEFFYVTGVNNSVEFTETSVERRTVLNVERGMNFSILKKENIESVNEKRKDNSKSISDIPGTPTSSSSIKPDYFEIVNTQWLKEAIQKIDNTQSPVTNLNSEATVVKEQFEYFLNRKMYEQ